MPIAAIIDDILEEFLKETNSGGGEHEIFMLPVVHQETS